MVLNKIIDYRQLVFTEGRRLMDSVMVANEAIYELTRKNKKSLFRKVDYEKAYDSIRKGLY